MYGALNTIEETHDLWEVITLFYMSSLMIVQSTKYIRLGGKYLGALKRRDISNNNRASSRTVIHNLSRTSAVCCWDDDNPIHYSGGFSNRRARSSTNNPVARVVIDVRPDDTSNDRGVIFETIAKQISGEREYNHIDTSIRCEEKDRTLVILSNLCFRSVNPHFISLV